MTKERIDAFGKLAAEYEAAGMSPVQAGDRAFMAIQARYGEPRPCPLCGNLYDHRYPCVC